MKNSLVLTSFVLLLVLGSNPVHAQEPASGLDVEDQIATAPVQDPEREDEEPAPVDADGYTWIQLFNGKNLDGWTPKICHYELGENYADTFRVENGLLKVDYSDYPDFGGRFGHLIFKDSFSHYVIRVEYRFLGEQCTDGPGWAFRNSGVMVHGQAPETMGKDQDFPVSIEVQLLGGDGNNDRSNANLCTPGTHVEMDEKLYTRHCCNSTSKTFHGDDWVAVEIEVLGGEVIRHKIDGEVVLEYQKPQLDPDDQHAKPLIKGDDLILREGYISLQSESHPIEFRKVELRIIDHL